jgi:hypothetical protein
MQKKEQMIHGQLASAVNFFYSQHDQHFKLLNTARHTQEGGHKEAE